MYDHRAFFVLNGALGKIRTPDPLIRSQVLYPAELQALVIQNVSGKLLITDRDCKPHLTLLSLFFENSLYVVLVLKMVMI